MKRLSFWVLLAALVGLAGHVPTTPATRAMGEAGGQVLAGCAGTYDCCLERHAENPEVCGAPGNLLAPPVMYWPSAEAKKKLENPYCVGEYARCLNEQWIGPCGTCLNKCMVQGTWDVDLCYEDW